MSELMSGRPSGAPENKAAALQSKAVGNDLSDALGELMQAFEGFKDANDQRLSEIESRSGADVLTTEKVDRISKALDEHKKALDQIALKQMRPSLERGSRAEPSEHKTAFEAYMRGGDEQPIRALDAKAMSYGSGADGGYLVPSETETEIGKRLAAISPMRSLATVRQVSTAVLKKPFATTGAATGWVAETASRPQTNSQTLAELSFPTMELYAMPAATQMLLDDSVVDLDEWIAAEVEAAFATQEGAAFVSGDGINKPKGFLDYTAVDEASWAWGSIGYVATGVSGALAASHPSDKLVDLVYSLKAGYRQNGGWMMNRKTQSTVRKLKDTEGNYLWQPPAVAGGKPSLMGYPLHESEDMPDPAANSLSIAFGDFARGYLIVDRLGVRVLRDPYTAKPYVLFYVTKRVGGGVQDFDAIKLLKFGVS